MSSVETLILAAGLGTRMKSDLPKVLHTLAGKAMLTWVVEACAQAAGKPPYVVIGPGQDQVQEQIPGVAGFIVQQDRLGTGHAARQARGSLEGKSDLLLVVNGDLPLLQAETLKDLIDAQQRSSGPMTLVSAQSSQARGFGRLERTEDGSVARIVEEREASSEQLANLELNVGAYCYQSGWLWEHLDKLRPADSGELYLTDLVEMAGEAAVGTVPVEAQDEIIGINNRVHLAEAEQALRKRINRSWMLAGVTLVDPATTYIDASVTLAQDVEILPNTHLKGDTQVGPGSRIGPNSHLMDATIGGGCHVLESYVEGAKVGDEVEIGPFARIRPGTHLGKGVHIGNFGELKNSRLAEGVKVGHFSYLGDATIGPDVNIGAGTITCNFDGRSKHPTEIESGAFIGSDTMLVAPVKIGKGARTGAGSVVTKDVPDRTLAAGVPARSIRKLKDDE